MQYYNSPSIAFNTLSRIFPQQSWTRRLLLQAPPGTALELLELGHGVTELAIDKLLQDDLPKWRRKPKDATGVLTLAEKPTQHDFTIFYLTFLWILWFPSCQSPTAKHVMLLRASRCASFFAQFVGIGLGMKIGKLPPQKAVAYCIQLYKWL